uniref:NADH dehydrogenase subunit 3 n=1 Tax=Asychis amphiglyptus TaxID=1931186 RepID=UPI0022DCDBB2|nr:NADH dehydrogenase subunit 3 [Asychis amphiglyptus]UZZ45813.1 NADH dehydrogenase subunit 3 [Asychis amphiglyptus]
MLMNSFIIGLAVILVILMGIAAFFLKARTLQKREKLSPFECGFDPYKKARMPFSMRFFLLAVIFVVFDIEIVLLLPIPLTLNTKNPMITLIGISIFIVLLILGLFHEWREGSLNWTE